MFDVEKQIEQWRVDLGGSELLVHSDIQELESHLREEMEHLKTAGLSDDEAFLVACRRLGDTATLEEEFAKINASRRFTNHLCWMLAGVLICLIGVHFGDTASQISRLIAKSTGLSHNAPWIVGDIARILTFSCVGILALGFTLRHAQARSCSRLRIFRRIRIAFELGLLTELLAISTMRTMSVPVAAFRMATLTNAPMVTIDLPWSIVSRLVWPALLVALVVVLHLAEQERSHVP